MGLPVIAERFLNRVKCCPKIGGISAAIPNLMSCADPEGGQDPLKITKLPIQHSMLAIIGPPAKRRLNGVSLEGPLMTR